MSAPPPRPPRRAAPAAPMSRHRAPSRRPAASGSRSAGRGGAASGAGARTGSRQRHRLRLLWLASAVALVAVVGRLTMVQFFDSSRYAAYAAGETEQKVVLPATRGAIYDRNGNLLAASVPTVDVVADDFQISHPASEARTLAPLLGLSVPTLIADLSEHNGYVVLTRQAPPSLETKIAPLGLAGITFLPDTRRTAPDASLFEPLLGFLGASGAGASGLEEEENATLSGKAGSELVGIAPGGVALPSSTSHVVAPHQGHSIVLTIDEPLQVEVTKDLTAEMKLQHAHSGVAVIESVKTGAILAMVDLVAGPKGVIRPAGQNLAVTSVYEPGSVMKIATFSYALKDGIITPSTPFRVPMTTTIGGYVFADAEYHPTETLTASQIIAQSSNVGTIHIASLLGMKRLGHAMADLGFGQPTGFNWPGESNGIVGPASSWVGSYTGSVPIGLGEAVTPLQILDAYSSVANGGVRETPHLVQATISGNGTEHATSTTSRRVLPAGIAHELIPMLEGVVQDGTAVCAEVPGYAVAGKTGTAQQVAPGGKGYLAGQFNATFVGFVPAQAPQLSGIVWLNRSADPYGGSASAPVFAKVMEYALRRYDIAPRGAPKPSPLTCSAISGA